MKPLQLVLLLAVLAVVGCGGAIKIPVATIGGATNVTLNDSSAATRAAVIAHCGHLPGITAVQYTGTQPDTLRLVHPQVGFSDRRISAVFRCLRSQPQVLRAAEPL